MHPFSLTKTQTEEVAGGNLADIVIGLPGVSDPFKEIGEVVTMAIPEDGKGVPPIFPPNFPKG